MLHKKRENIAGEWAKKGLDIKNGDQVEILSQGQDYTSQFKDAKGNDVVQVIFSIKTRNGSKNVPFNQTSINAFVEAYGEDDSNWVGKTANVLTVVIPGKPAWYYFAPDGYKIGERGLEKEGDQDTQEELPTIQQDDDDELKLENVPF